MAFSDEIYEALLGLKKFNENNIYLNPATNTQKNKIERMFELLFNKYLEDLEAGCKRTAIGESMKDMGKSYLRSTDSKRKVVDFIAGMTDDFFNNQFEELFVPQSYGYSL